jgi:hypothetical protein
LYGLRAFGERQGRPELGIELAGPSLPVSIICQSRDRPLMRSNRSLLLDEMDKSIKVFCG